MNSAKLISILTLECLFSLFVLAHNEQRIPRLLLIAFDGFRWDYLGRTDTPNFDRIKREGVHARKGTKSVFAANTYPNLWTIVTGLYPESHGIINNYIIDPNIDKKFVAEWIDPDYVNDPRYYGGEPIWVTNQLKSHDGRSGVIMWVGSSQAVKWIRPTLQEKYTEADVWKEKMETVVQWFTSENFINLGVMYFPEPDTTAHHTGPASVNTTKQIERCDETFGYLLQLLEQKDLLDDINIIITADHGFTSTPQNKTINLDDFIDQASYKLVSTSPVASIYPHEGNFDQVYNSLRTASDKPNSHFQVFKASEIPEKYHYKNTPRVPPIMALADLQYSFVTKAKPLTLVGSHGYDPDYQEMNAVFMAMGPSLKQNFAVETFPNVDVYAFMCHLLHIKPAPNNGSLDIVGAFIQEGHHNTWWTLATYVLVLIVIASVGGVFSVAACRQHRYLKRKRVQLRLSPVQSSGKYPVNTHSDRERARHLLSEEEVEEEFNDAKDDDHDEVLNVISQR